MTLASGTKLGPYEVLSPLGAGGMGEVYRAHDTRLDRHVAIKVLPSHLASDATLQQRLEREAKAVSKLSHPHICTLYDIGHQDGVDFLVMELLEGETLEQRLIRGPLPPEQTLRYSAQIADALAKAHKLGITHRDLKPANIMLTKSGAKLMDFGLAKQADVTPLADALTATQSKLTGEGSIVGTFLYMAPEQLEGKPADARTDIFALGEVMYEMATAQAPFSGKSRASLIASIMTTEPTPMTQLQPLLPPALERVVKKCMAKDPDERWQSASDLASELGWIADSRTTSGTQPGLTVASVSGGRNRERLAWMLAAGALVAAIAIAAVHFASREPHRVLRAQIVAPDKVHFNFSGDNGGPPVISPNGTHVVFSALAEGKNQLYLRSLDSIALQPLPGTEDATFPFWSPDSRSIAFFAGGKLRRVEISGGSAVTLCEAPGGRGGSWGSTGTILFSPNFAAAIFQVSANGGNPVAVTKLDAKYTTHRWPWFLPDGQHFLYLAANHNNPDSSDTGVFVASLDGKENRLLIPTRSNAIYASGNLLFVRDTALLAQPFDVDSRQFKGDPTVLNADVQVDGTVWRGIFSASDDRTLIYQPGLVTTGMALTWLDRSGREVGTASARDAYRQIQISPDNKSLVLSIGESLTALWVYDLARNTKTRLTFGNGKYSDAAWSPDGSQVAYTVVGAAMPGSAIMSRAPSGAGEEKQLLAPVKDVQQVLCDWSPDGRYLIYREGEIAQGTGFDLWILPLFGDHKPFPYITGPGDQANAAFSPDGRWVAYVSNENTRQEVYVAPFPWTGAKWQVSSSGGNLPRWRGDGAELFFAVPGISQLMAAEVNGRGPSFEVGEVRALFTINNMSPNTDNSQFAVTRDGQRFVAMTTGETGSLPLTLVQNWTAELRNK
jgi:eukaryotic-like serine/threonine-protein kinase